MSQEYKITITFRDEMDGNVNVSLRADPPVGGADMVAAAKAEDGDPRPDHISPAQAMQLEWFAGIYANYSDAADHDWEEDEEDY